MRRRGGTRIKAERKPVVVIVGEDRNDRQTLRILLEACCPQLRGRMVETNDAVRLRDASPKTLTERVNLLGKAVRARAAREDADVACVFVHEDLDRPDGDHYLMSRQRVQEALTLEFGNAHYVLAVWEIEAWLLLFPEALAGVVQTWRVPVKYQGTDTGRLDDPKRIMMREVAHGARRYRVADAPIAFAKAVEIGCLDRPVGTNRSWAQLRADVKRCCDSHIPLPRSPQRG